MTEKRKFFIAFALTALLAAISVFLFLQNKTFKSTLHHQNMQIAVQKEWMDSIQNQNLMGRMSEVLNKTEEEVQLHTDRSVSDERIESIAALCFLMKPYASIQGDSLSKRKRSPERGQILLMLSGMNMNSISFDRIKRKATFAYADLRDADLNGIDLQGVDLNGADLENVNLQGALLNEADLSFANLWGAHMKNAQLMRTNLKRANLNWADLNGANLESADLHEADLTAAQMRNVNLQYANLQWAELNDIFLTESNLSCTDVFRANFKRAQLVKTNFTDSNLNYADISESNLSEAKMNGAELTDMLVSGEDWLSQLKTWKVEGAVELSTRYKVIFVKAFDHSYCQIKKKGS